MPTAGVALRIIQCVVAIVLLLFGAFVPSANGEVTAEISIEQALSDFYQNNYDILISKYEIDKAQADYIGARLLPNPNLSFNYTFISLQRFPQTTDNTQTVTRLDQLIELGGKRGLRTGAALEGIEASKLTQKDTVRTLLIGFYTVFFQINTDILSVDMAKSELKRFDRTMEIGEKRFNAGFLSLVDFTKLKLARIDLENNLTTAESQMRDDAEQFSFLLGSADPVRAALHISEDFPQYTENDLVESANKYRFDLLSIERQLKASEFNKDLAHAQAIPDITAGVELDTVGQGNSPSIGFGVSLPIPLFNRNQGEIARRHAEHSQLEIQRDKLKRQIVSDIRHAVNSYATAITVFDSYKGRKEAMQELMSRTEKAFSLGGITMLDLLDTEKQYRDFMTKYNQALVQANLARELLKVYTGEIK
ncbi:MAG: TolC family protein [Nitrospirae bacterium]|nr:TolC family protein [Nitrospirota bacterium]